MRGAASTSAATSWSECTFTRTSIRSRWRVSASSGFLRSSGRQTGRPSRSRADTLSCSVGAARLGRDDRMCARCERAENAHPGGFLAYQNDPQRQALPNAHYRRSVSEKGRPRAAEQARRAPRLHCGRRCGRGRTGRPAMQSILRRKRAAPVAPAIARRARRMGSMASGASPCSSNSTSSAGGRAPDERPSGKDGGRDVDRLEADDGIRSLEAS